MLVQLRVPQRRVYFLLLIHLHPLFIFSSTFSFVLLILLLCFTPKSALDRCTFIFLMRLTLMEAVFNPLKKVAIEMVGLKVANRTVED